MISGDVHGPVSNMGNYNSGVIANTVNTVNIVQSNKSTQESLLQHYLENDWPRSPKAAYNAHLGGTVTREACTPGTRVDILNRIYAWAENPSSSSPSIFWLTGEAGSGKSTIAYSVAHHFDGQEADARKDPLTRKILGANFFCSRQFEETRQRMNIIPTIVDQLARHSQPYANALLKANTFDSVNVMSRQMKDLLVGPWKQSVSEHAAELPPFLVVVDALDEIEDRGGSAFLKELLRMTYESHLHGIKFLITSRPDADFTSLCSSFTSDAICALYDVPRDTVKTDIKTYLQEKLPKLWGTPEVDNLMNQADGLFIFAATAVRYITPPTRMTTGEQIQLLGKLGIHAHPTVSRNPNASPIDALYEQVMCTAFGELDEKFLENRLYALHTLLCTQERVSTSVAAELQFGDLELVDLVVDELRAVLYVKEDRVFWYHASFPDFMFSQARSGSVPLGIKSSAVDIHCEEAAHHARLARSCFRIMKSHLRFNICDLPSSFLLDSEVPDLNDRIRANISDSLRYSCLHWAQHLAQTSSDDGRTDISDFLPLRVLFWIEVMNLLDSRALCTPMLQQAREYILKGDGGCVSDLRREVGQAANFATYFGGSQAFESTPHLYISSLATWSRDSRLSRSWKKQFSRVPAFEQTGDEVLLTISADSAVKSVAFSNNGRRIVSGLGDNSVRIWNASTGVELRRLSGHSDLVRSVAFSSNDTRIVSGSGDHSVRIWDASTGEELRRLDGHSGTVYCVAFSRDDARIVSGSGDKSVRVWDASTGAKLMRLNGHYDHVYSVAFSSDNVNTRIVSGSGDQSVRVWDASTGAELRRLNGHSDEVYSVAFSNDDTRIVSGSGDQSVLVWGVSTDAEPRKLDGHWDEVYSVAFSSDDTRIVSGSGDTCVWIWDASTDAILNGHSSCVNSVAFSSDDTRIVSGSDDKSVRVWDASSDTEKRRPNGHSGKVFCVAISSDDTLIASGSSDNSVRLWDASTGAELRKLDGHSGTVYSVAISSSRGDTRIVSGSHDESVRVWDASTGEELRRLNDHYNPVHSVALSNDDTRIVSGSDWGSMRVWDALTGDKLASMNRHSGTVYSVAFSSDDSRIVSGSGDKSVRVWDTSTGAELKRLNGHSSPVNSVAFSSDDTRIVSGSGDQSVRVWDVLTGAELSNLDDHRGEVYSVAFSSDDTRIVSGSGDRSVRVWDASTGEELRRLNGHSGSVHSVTFSSDDTRIVSGESEKSVRVWDLVSHLNNWELARHGGWILSLPHHQRLMWVPHDIQKILNPPGNLLNISSRPSATVNFADSRIGPSWAACHTPKMF